MISQTARTPKQIGTAIRRARRTAGLNQSALAEKVGTWQETISKIENGATRAHIDMICNIFAALDLEIVVRPRSKGSTDAITEVF